MRSLVAAMFAACLLASCFGGDEDRGGPDGPRLDGVPSPADAHPGADAAPGQSPPVIQSLTTSAPTITEGGSVTFSALVTDADGDLAGGTLRDVAGAVDLGTYTSQGGGAFTFELTWTAIHAARAIDFLPGGETRAYLSRFVDAQGHEATRSLDLQLICLPSDRAGACDGVCTDLRTADHCGSCENACELDQGCEGQDCVPAAWSSCVDLSNYGTCNDYCESLGHACSNLCNSSFGVPVGMQAWYFELTCANDPGFGGNCDSGGAAEGYECCCTQ